MLLDGSSLLTDSARSSLSTLMSERRRSTFVLRAALGEARRQSMDWRRPLKNWKTRAKHHANQVKDANSPFNVENE